MEVVRYEEVFAGTPGRCVRAAAGEAGAVAADSRAAGASSCLSGCEQGSSFVPSAACPLRWVFGG